MKRGKTPAERRKERKAIELRKRGLTCTQIAERLGGVSRSTVGRWCLAAEERGEIGSFKTRGRPRAHEAVSPATVRRQFRLDDPRARLGALLGQPKELREWLLELLEDDDPGEAQGALQDAVDVLFEAACVVVVAATLWDERHAFASLFPKSGCDSLTEVVRSDLGALMGELTDGPLTEELSRWPS